MNIIFMLQGYLIVLVFYLFMSFSFFYTLCFSVFFIHSFSLSLFASSFSTSSFHSSINCLLSFCYLLLSTSFLSSNLLYFKHFSHSVIPILSLYVRLLIFSFYARASIMSTLENLIFRKFLSRNTFSWIFLTFLLRSNRLVYLYIYLSLSLCNSLFFTSSLG